MKKRVIAVVAASAVTLCTAVTDRRRGDCWGPDAVKKLYRWGVYSSNDFQGGREDHVAPRHAVSERRGNTEGQK